MTIILNGKNIVVDTATLTYEKIVELAGKRGTPTITYAYKKSRDGGEIVEDDTISIEDDMVITCMHTGNA